MSLLRALAPGLVNIRLCIQVGGWNVTSHDIKPARAHHQMQRNDIGAPDSRLLDLLQNIAPPEEGNPPRARQRWGQGEDIVPRQVLSVYAPS